MAKKRNKFVTGMVIFLAVLTTLAFTPFVFGPPASQPSYDTSQEGEVDTSDAAVTAPENITEEAPTSTYHISE